MLEKLFTSKNRVKLLEYFLLTGGKGKIREISRKTKMPVSAVSRELYNLVKLSILKQEKDRFILNEECTFLAELRNILLKTDSFAFELKGLSNDKGIIFSFVFGSFANDKYQSDSDIDLFVIGNISNIAINKTLKPIERKLHREINTVIWPLKDLKKKSQSSFIKEIAKKDIIMVKGSENELRKTIGRK
jgi:predicted nucleotidyltransferase|tara:strand:- start:990 stop:1556 length:567 start_codon:yes stop_codon:yes gene_type:complete